MNPDNFDGTTCFKTFLVQFRYCTRCNQWNELGKLHYLRWTLKGVAAQVLCGADEMSYRQLVSRLHSRFGCSDMEKRYQAELQH